MRKSKYNIDTSDSGKLKRTYNNILFDSVLEKDYYVYLLELQAEGEISTIMRQPKFILQNKFTKNNKNYQAICYVPDFQVLYSDGSEIIYDTKGSSTTDAKMKRKMFDLKYPEKILEWVNFSLLDGGWVSVEVIDKGKKKRKKEKTRRMIE